MPTYGADRPTTSEDSDRRSASHLYSNCALENPTRRIEPMRLMSSSAGSPHLMDVNGREGRWQEGLIRTAYRLPPKSSATLYFTFRIAWQTSSTWTHGVPSLTTRILAAVKARLAGLLRTRSKRAGETPQNAVALRRKKLTTPE
jgi:hypothetical protein